MISKKDKTFDNASRSCFFLELSVEFRTTFAADKIRYRVIGGFVGQA